jgi:coenzyme F420-0:L-glutamate ligase/coenzyme F420-1:gamma-L-glutamate ligase
VTPSRLEITALEGIPTVAPGDDIAGLILAHAPADGLRDGDILVVAQKIVSKAEDRFVDLATVTPSAEAEILAAETEKDPRLVELILQESQAIARHRPGVIIAVHRLGYVLANAGIDASNVGRGADTVLLLPKDPDGTAAALRARLETGTGVKLAVIVSDSLGRAWRMGTAGIALGSAGLPALLDLVEKPDRDGRPLRVSTVGLADELAAAASLVQGQGDEGRPVALIRGYDVFAAAADEIGAAALIRPAEQDLFR